MKKEITQFSFNNKQFPFLTEPEISFIKTIQNTGIGQIEALKNPRKVLTTAVRFEFSATVDLTRNRVTADTVHLLVYYQEEMNLQ